MMKMHDIVVIGGGPAGSRSAQLLSKDFDVHVIEEHPVSGDPVQCTGLITSNVVEHCGVKPEILNKLSGATFEFPNGKEIYVSSKDKALLIDRGDLDRKMAQAAMDVGAKYHYSRGYVSHSISDGFVKIETTECTMESIMIIGADGHSSKVAQSLGNNGPKEYVRGIQYDIKYRIQDQDTVRLFLGNHVAPGFFAWMIPFGDNTRVGLCTDWNRGLPSEYFKAFLKKRKLDDCEIIAKNSGKIPLGGRRITYGDNVLLIGDAAGQVKPLSGGGLYPALLSAYSLGNTVKAAMDKGDFSSKMLSSYEKSWMKDVGNSLNKAYKIRKYYDKFTDDELNFVYDKMSNEKYAKLFQDADIDNPGPIVKTALKDVPLMLSALPMMLKVRMRR